MNMLSKRRLWTPILVLMDLLIKLSLSTFLQPTSSLPYTKSSLCRVDDRQPTTSGSLCQVDDPDRNTSSRLTEKRRVSIYSDDSDDFMQLEAIRESEKYSKRKKRTSLSIVNKQLKVWNL